MLKRRGFPKKTKQKQNKKIQATEILLINRSTPLRSSTLTLTPSSEQTSTGLAKKDFAGLRQTVFADKVKKMRESLAASSGQAGGVEAGNAKSIGQLGQDLFLGGAF